MLIHPQAQCVQQLCQYRCPLCNVLPLPILDWRVPAVRGQDTYVKRCHRTCLQRPSGLGLQHLTAAINSKEMERVNVDTVGLASGENAKKKEEEGRRRLKSLHFTYDGCHLRMIRSANRDKCLNLSCINLISQSWTCGHRLSGFLQKNEAGFSFSSMNISVSVMDGFVFVWPFSHWAVNETRHCPL